MLVTCPAPAYPLVPAWVSDPADAILRRPLTQPTPAPAPTFAERIRTGAGRRALGLGLTLLIELLLLYLLLSLGTGRRPGIERAPPTVVTFTAEEVSEEKAETPSPEPQQRAEERPRTQPPQPETPQPPRPADPIAPPPAAVTLPMPQPMPPAAAPPARPQPSAPRRVYGPVDNRSAAFRDTERVGTAPNGEPLYAAEWYREPDPVALRAYLSGARGPGWGLIACRTAPDYRVEDCVGLQEYPEGSQMIRSVLAAAWEFRVRPPRRGGQVLVGSWVRIRISYGMDR